MSCSISAKVARVGSLQMINFEIPTILKCCWRGVDVVDGFNN
jgi:hypothetical protein